MFFAVFTALLPLSTVDHDIEPSEHLYTPPSPQSTMGFDEVSEEEQLRSPLYIYC